MAKAVTETGPGIGHNQPPQTAREKRKSKQDQMLDQIQQRQPTAVEKLRSFVDRMDNLLDEKDALNEDVRDLASEVRAAGFNAKIFRTMMSRRRKNPDVIEEEDALLDLYEGTLQRPN